MRKDVREFIRRLEAVGLTVESTPGHYRVLRDGKPLRKANGMPFMLPFSPDTIRWRKAAVVELRKLGIGRLRALGHAAKEAKSSRFGARPSHVRAERAPRPARHRHDLRNFRHRRSQGQDSSPHGVSAPQG